MRRGCSLLAVAGVAVPLVGCHVTVQNEVTRPGKIDRVRSPGGAVPREPTIVVDDQGRLRFVEPLDCPTEETVTELRGIERRTKPNIATFVIGVIGTAAGGILLATAAGNTDPAGNPLTYAGVLSLGVGLPFAIGPWIRHRTSLEPLPDGAPYKRPGPSEPCGDRPFAATRATLMTSGVEVHGAVDGDGVFAVSPFAIVDAFVQKAMPSLGIVAAVEAPSGARTIEVVVDGSVLASRAAAFLANADFDAKVGAMRLVPKLTPGTLRISLTSKQGAPVVRLVLPVENAGGPSYGLRGAVTATGQPAIDRRIVYIGHVAKGASITRELLIPVSPSAADALRNANVDVSVELRDVHGTAPSTPIRFSGPLLVDAPR